MIRPLIVLAAFAALHAADVTPAKAALQATEKRMREIRATKEDLPELAELRRAFEEAKKRFTDAVDTKCALDPDYAQLKLQQADQRKALKEAPATP